MERKNESQREGSTDESFTERPDTTTTSLTDLIDEMDRAALRRALASRDYTGSLTVTAHSLHARPKS